MEAQEEIKHKKSRNSLLEILRFLFALWVVYYHSFFPVKFGSFNHGYLAVEFFFILTGLFLDNSLNKACEDTFFKGGLKLIWTKVKKLDFTLIVSWIFVFVYSFSDFANFSFLGYLWYIGTMLDVMVILYTIKRLTLKKPKLFYLICGILMVACFALEWTCCFGVGILRGFAAIMLGVFFIKNSKNKFNKT